MALVPIVAGAALNDLAFGDPKKRPDAAMGYEACRNASASERRQGNVGAGTGACVGRLAGNARGTMKGGLGTASLRVGELIVGAIVAVNCNGDVLDAETGQLLAGTLRSGQMKDRRRPQPAHHACGELQGRLPHQHDDRGGGHQRRFEQGSRHADRHERPGRLRA